MGGKFHTNTPQVVKRWFGDWPPRLIYNVDPMKIRKIHAAMALAIIAVSSTVARADSVMDQLGAPADNKTAMVQAGDVQAVIKPATTSAAPGQDLKVSADFTIAPPWHVYGKPIATDYVATAVTFDGGVVAKQSMEFPKPEMVKFESLGQTLPVYKGSLHADGNLKLRPDLKPGAYKLTGKVDFQECSDTICKMPQSLKFEIPITVAAAAK